MCVFALLLKDDDAAYLLGLASAVLNLLEQHVCEVLVASSAQLADAVVSSGELLQGSANVNGIADESSGVLQLHAHSQGDLLLAGCWHDHGLARALAAALLVVVVSGCLPVVVLPIVELFRRLDFARALELTSFVKQCPRWAPVRLVQGHASSRDGLIRRALFL